MMELRKKKDEEERIRIEQKKIEDAEKLEEYYIMLKMMDYAQKENEKESDNYSKVNDRSKLKKGSFFTTDIVNY